MDARTQLLLIFQGTCGVNIAPIHPHDMESRRRGLRFKFGRSRRRSRREPWISRYINNYRVLSVRIGDGHNIAVMSIGVLEAKHGGTNSILGRMEVAPGV